MKLPKPSLVITVAWNTIKTIFRLIGKVLAAIFFLAVPFGMLRFVTEQHWLFGLPFILMLSVGVYFGIRDYQAGRMDTWQGIVALGCMLSIIVSAFTFFSFVLNKFGLAHYHGFHPNFVSNADYVNGTFFELYFWELLEIIPGVRVNEAFNRRTPPLQRSGFWAGLLVLTFRVVIVFIVLDVFRKWWGARKKSKAHLPTPEPVDAWVVSASMGGARLAPGRTHE
jgi:hypothetical protein